MSISGGPKQCVLPALVSTPAHCNLARCAQGSAVLLHGPCSKNPSLTPVPTTSRSHTQHLSPHALELPSKPGPPSKHATTLEPFCDRQPSTHLSLMYSLYTTLAAMRVLGCARRRCVMKHSSNSSLNPSTTRSGFWPKISICRLCLSVVRWHLKPFSSRHCFWHICTEGAAIGSGRPAAGRSVRASSHCTNMLPGQSYRASSS